jgi:hypothetical protein
MLQLAPDFGSPVMAVFGVISTWLLLFFPFALWARQIARADALNGFEAFMLGQSCGPVGVWLVMRANKAAAANAYRDGLLVDHVRTAPEPSYSETLEQVEQRVKEQRRPELSEMPGGRAFRAAHDVRPAGMLANMDKVGLTDPVRPEPAPRNETLPFEPPPPPVTKAAGAWRPPPSADPKFMHSDEKPDDATLPEKGGGNG